MSLMTFNNMSPQLLLDLYRKVYLIRACEEAIRKEYAADGMKTPVHLAIGAEGIEVGVLGALSEVAPIYGTYRNHGLFLARTDDVDGFFAELYGRVTGSSEGKAGSMHLLSPRHHMMLTSAVVATTIPVAVGHAWTFKRTQQNETPVAVFFGEGACEEGVFWESLNFSALKGLPILYICEDNGLAIHTPLSERQGYRDLRSVVEAFPIAYDEGSGYCAKDVYSKTQAVLDRMKQKQCPGFLRLTYHRFLEHVGIQKDYAAGYRLEPTQDELMAMDPVHEAQKSLREAGIEVDAIQNIHHPIDLRIQNSLVKAKTAEFPKKENLYEHVFK